MGIRVVLEEWNDNKPNVVVDLPEGYTVAWSGDKVLTVKDVQGGFLFGAPLDNVRYWEKT